MTSRIASTASAAARSLWLSELARAIDEAQWLAWRLGMVEGRNDEALELYVQLEAARAELEALRRWNRLAVRDRGYVDELPEPASDGPQQSAP